MYWLAKLVHSLWSVHLAISQITLQLCMYVYIRMCLSRVFICVLAEPCTIYVRTYIPRDNNQYI